MKKIYILISTGFLFVSGFSQNITIPPPNISDTENYVYTREYLAETPISSNSIPQVQSVTYFDGLGREKQKINIKSSPLGKDVVIRIEYDALGRQIMDFLPMPQQNTTNGGIYSSVTTPYTESVGNPLYGGTAPFFSKKEIEYSPLNRPLSFTAPGAWSTNNKKSTLDYKFNSAGEVKKYVTATAWLHGATSSALSISGTYSANQLYKNITTDEDGNVKIIFKNKLGQTVLVRKVVSATENADTYYVYNEYQDLAFVLSPLASVKSTLTSTDLDELCYQYRYDGKNRLVEKKIPGKGWEYMVYDNQDRLVMKQDANMGANKQWTFTKYDKFGRVVYTGIYTGSQNYTSAGRNAEQIILNGKGSNNVERTISNFAQPGLLIYYDNDAAKNYPNTITKIFSVNYYDSYPTGTPTIPATILTQTVLGQNAQTANCSTKSLPTASFVNNMEANGWTKTYIWYDTKGRTIGTHTINHLGGYTKTESLLDLTGAVQETYTKHKRKNADAELVVKENFIYDHQNRLVKQYHEVVGITPKELLKENHYNEIGQLDQKKVGADQYGNSVLQTINYSYNIRGWMTGINRGDILHVPVDETYTLTNGKLFGYKIKYNDSENTSIAPAKYNGSITEIDWIDKDSSLKRYGYQYDKLNRLLAGIYQDPGLTVPETHINDELLTYDLNGNIKTLVRKSKHGKYYTPIVIDNLTYNPVNGTGNSNKIFTVTDASNNSSGYEGGGNPISYDANGSITAMPDKGISAISYNYLDLPVQVNQNANVTNYYYRSDGVKIKKQYTLTNASGTKTINTEYLDGFQYSTPNTDPIRKALEEPDDNTLVARTAGEEEAFSKDTSKKIAVVDPGNPPADNMILSFFPTDEGYYDYENFRYIYQYKDHLGNIRVSFVKNSAGLPEITDKNDYYPFGMNFLKPSGTVSVYDPMAIPYNYKFGAKELQETGMYDFGARMYMPDLGRWGVIDPLSEYTKETYSYVWNNPINFFDPTGMEGESASSDSGGGGGGEAGAGGGTESGPGGPGGCCPDGITGVKTLPNGEKETQIQEVVIVGKAKSGSNNTTTNSNNFALTRAAPKNFAYVWFAPAIYEAAVAAMAVISGVAAWQITDKAKDVDITLPPYERSETGDVGGEIDIEEVRIPAPKPVSDSGFKTPEDVLAGKRVDFARGKGERGFAGKTSGTDNPYKHVKPDTKKPGNVIYKHPQSGKKVSRPASPDEKAHFGIK